MSDEKLEEQKEETKEKSFIELAKEHKIEEFKSVDDLAKSYKELRKQFSSRKPSKTDSEETTLQKFEDYFENAASGDTELDGDLGNLAKDLIKGNKIPAKLADKVVSTAAGQVADLVTGKNRKAVTKILKDDAAKEAIERALGTDEAIKDFTKRYHSGTLTPQEAKLLVKIGSTGAEEKSGVDLDKRAGISKGSKQSHLMEILRDPTHAYFNQAHPMHKDAVREVNMLKKELAIDGNF